MGTLSYQSDRGPGYRATLGIVVLRTDEAMEVDLRAFLPEDGVALHHTRIPFEPTVTKETLARMAGDLAESTGLLPDAAPFDAIGYGCTSGSAVIGETRVAEVVQSIFSGVSVTNPLTAAKAALAALGAERVALVTPYVPEVSQALCDRLAESGIEIATLASFEVLEDAAVARITPNSILEAIVSTGKKYACDAVFAACTNLRTSSILAEAEDKLGKPVISSNQALAWHMMRLANLDGGPPTLGRLASV